MTRVDVYENEPFPVRPDQEEALQRVLAGRLKRVARDKLRITGIAGHVRLPNGEVWNIRSRKADAACLLTWLAYADPVLEALRLLDSLPEQTQEGDLGPLVARAFCVATWRAIQTSGLLRAYHRQHIRSPVIRGRIDFARLAYTGGDLSRMPCIVFSRLPQTPLNRLLAAAVERIRRDPALRLAAGASLPPLAAALAEIPSLVDPALLSARMTLSRLERPFESSYALACLIIRSTGMASGTELDGLGFLVDLANLFERAVARAFHDSSLEARSKQPIHLLRESPAARLTKAIPMQLDVYLPNVHGHRIVIDAKYKTRIATANLQQMITYCVATGAQHGVLVFPAGHLDDKRTYLLVPPHLGATPLRIHIVEFDLTQTKLSGWHEAGRRVAAEAVQKVLGSGSPHSPAESRPQLS